MIITSKSVSLTTAEAFDCIYRRNKHLWAEAIDAIQEYAQGIYFEHPDSIDSEDPFADGISFDSSAHSIQFRHLSSN